MPTEPSTNQSKHSDDPGEPEGGDFPESNSKTYEITQDDAEDIDVDSIEELENLDRPLSPELQEAVDYHKNSLRTQKIIGILILLFILLLTYIFLI